MIDYSSEPIEPKSPVPNRGRTATTPDHFAAWQSNRRLSFAIARYLRHGMIVSNAAWATRPVTFRLPQDRATGAMPLGADLQSDW